jgi:CDP-diacylglycerol--glycerol-3-phosphate 3-phosphatidyltransferase
MNAWTPKLLDGGYERTRLQGTVWERSDIARLAYQAMTAIGRGLGRLGVSPNALTWLSLVFAAGAGVALAFGAFGTGIALIVVSGLCDVFDGAVARATGKVSPFGALLDSTVDRLSDALPLVGLSVFYASQPLFALIPALAMVGGFVVPYVRARAETVGVTLPPLFMRRAERIVLLVLSLLLGMLPLGTPLPTILTLLGIALMGVLSFAGAATALRAARDALVPASGREPRRGQKRQRGEVIRLEERDEVSPSVPSNPLTASGP